MQAPNVLYKTRTATCYSRKVLTLCTSKDRKAEAASTDVHPCSNLINGLSFHSIHCNGVPQLFPFSLPGWSQLGSSRTDTVNLLSPNPHHWLSSSPSWSDIHVRWEGIPPVLWDIHFKHPGPSPASQTEVKQRHPSSPMAGWLQDRGRSKGKKRKKTLEVFD